MAWQSIAALVSAANNAGKTIGAVALAAEAEEQGVTQASVAARMDAYLQVMQDAVDRGLSERVVSHSGLVGGQAQLLAAYAEKGPTLAGATVVQAAAQAIAAMEVNAAMGRIVAAPTAGSSGIVPAVILTVAKQRSVERTKLVEALFCAGAVGLVIANTAGIAGAEGGCQVEVGSAAAMAAAAATEIAGGTPDQAAHAVALMLKNVLGLACDPVAGLVEVPCVKRNGIYAPMALLAADMALAGIKSVIPADDVIQAMADIGRLLPPALKETAQGGLAATPTGKSLALRLCRR